MGREGRREVRSAKACKALQLLGADRGLSSPIWVVSAAACCHCCFQISRGGGGARGGVDGEEMGREGGGGGGEELEMGRQ